MVRETKATPIKERVKIISVTFLEVKYKRNQTGTEFYTKQTYGNSWNPECTNYI
jgi:hypothetical protein